MREPSRIYAGPSFSSVAGITCAVMAGAIVLLGACTSTPQAPPASLDAARIAITTAEKGDAGQYAAVELGAARQKLAMADKAVLANRMIGADQLAQEALADAELASARTEEAKAAAVNKEMQVAAAALAAEMQRAGEQR